MPRKARVVIPGIAHHVIQRGNNRQYVFTEEEDFSNYCYWMNKYAVQYKITVLAYCLMSNHVHFIVVPQDKEGLARVFNTVHMRYAQYMNFKRKTSGHLWQGRFFSCIMDDDHLFRAIRYVEQNPVRARMVEFPWDYPWSSARWHLKKPVKKYIKVTDTTLIDKKYWKDYLFSADPAVDEKIRKITKRGKALAQENFIEYWENKLKCSLRILKPGPQEQVKR